MANNPVTIGRATLIYALQDAQGRTRYIGKTIRTLSERLAQHRRAAHKSKLPIGRWLRKNPNASIILVERVEVGGDWAARERFWIQRGSDLLNLTLGGEGLAGHKFSSDHKRKISDALKTGAEFACEQCSATFWRKRRDINKGNCRFCSRECYAASIKGISRPVPLLCMERGVEAAAQARRGRTNCKRGHPLSGDNLFITSAGSRGCKECRKIHKRTYRSKSNG